MMKWDQSSLLAATFPDNVSNLLLYGQWKQCGPGIIYLQVLNARHSLRSSPFLLTSVKVGNLSRILQITKLRLTEPCKISRIKHLPLAVCTGQPAVSHLGDGFPGLKD